MKNIIAFSGTHGTGKSSSAYRLASKLKDNGYNIVLVDELARECPLKINKDAGELTQFWIIAAQQKREIELMDKYEYVISDRSVFDTLAYAVTLELFKYSDISTIQKYTQNYYKHIFVLDPKGFNFQVADGVRDMDPNFRLAVHNNLINLYDHFSIDYTYVNTNSDLEKKMNTIFNLRSNI
ncbi:ATP-binding protein [Candidatus Dojkabacteria bacterium]|jgi:thymidylate kinase|nr:ATP-binding protein [Candidatus Dojkabacteria bacterium]